MCVPTVWRGDSTRRVPCATEGGAIGEGKVECIASRWNDKDPDDSQEGPAPGIRGAGP